MKNLILTLAIIPFLFSCENQSASKIDDSPLSGTISEIDERNNLVNKFVDAYENADPSVALSLYDENAIVHVNYEGIKNIDRNTTTMFYNNGEVYTNYWYTWNGTNRQTGELLVARGYAWFKWEGMKVVESYNAFDPTEYNKAFIE